MTEVRHGYLTTAEGIHVPYQWSYATATARAAATGFVSTDVGKLARQIDNNTLWLLTNVTPTWAAVTVGTGLTSTHIPVVGSNGLLTDADNIHRNATSGNVMVGTSTDITGATLQVAGAVVVSDGAGAELAHIAGTTGAFLGSVYRSGRKESLADDTVYSFTPAASVGIIILALETISTGYLIMMYRAASSPLAAAMVIGSSVEVVTPAALTNGSGTDGKLTVTCYSDGKIYVSNRLGSSRNFSWTILGGSL